MNRYIKHLATECECVVVANIWKTKGLINQFFLMSMWLQVFSVPTKWGPDLATFRISIMFTVTLRDRGGGLLIMNRITPPSIVNVTPKQGSQLPHLYQIIYKTCHMFSNLSFWFIKCIHKSYIHTSSIYNQAPIICPRIFQIQQLCWV